LKVLITGGAGYVGSVLIEHLLNEGYDVTCLDRFFFGDEFLKKLSQGKKLTLVKDDIRWFDPKILEGIDVVMDLAAISNDPAGDLDPSKTYDINHLGRARVAKLSKMHGVKQYILASSASIYGFQEETVNEDSKVNPLTTYSKANRMAEVESLPLNDDTFTVTALRFSSIYGFSPRMRFDLAVNNMALDLFKSGKIVITGDGKQWRPFLHIKDAARAYQLVIESPKEKIAGHIFNVGSDNQNYEINKLAREVGDSIGLKYEIEFKGTLDHRSYIASFKKIKDTLGFTPKYNVSDGSNEIYDALKKGILTDSIKTKTLEWYKHLQATQKLVEQVSLRDTIL
jgi:nucleoside-diphosphate-sugar epimerase